MRAVKDSSNERACASSVYPFISSHPPPPIRRRRKRWEAERKKMEARLRAEAKEAKGDWERQYRAALAAHGPVRAIGDKTYDEPLDPSKLTAKQIAKLFPDLPPRPPRDPAESWVALGPEGHRYW